MGMHIRRYASEDRVACLQILGSNVPTYFRASDEAEFANLLEQQRDPFWVAEHDGSVVGCGGLAPDHPETGTATLCWGIVAAHMHHRGVGRALLEHRLRTLAADYPWIERVQVNTTQLVQGFFERHGFVAVSSEAGGYGPGLDHVRLSRRLGGGR